MTFFRRALVAVLSLLAFSLGTVLGGTGGDGGGVVILPFGKRCNSSWNGSTSLVRAKFDIADFRNGVVLSLPLDMQNAVVTVDATGASVQFGVIDGEMAMDGEALEQLFSVGVTELDITFASPNGLMLRLTFRMHADYSAVVLVY